VIRWGTEGIWISHVLRHPMCSSLATGALRMFFDDNDDDEFLMMCFFQNVCENGAVILRQTKSTSRRQNVVPKLS